MELQFQIQLIIPVTPLALQPWDEEKLQEPGNYIRTMRILNADENNDGILFAVPLEVTLDRVFSPICCSSFQIKCFLILSMLVRTLHVYSLIMAPPFYSSNEDICKALYEGKDVPEAFYSSDVLTFSNEGIELSWSISRGFLMQNLLPTIFLEAAVTFIVMAVGLMLMLYISRKSYEPMENILKRLPPRSDGEHPIDEFKYINYVLDDLSYSKHFFEESVQELRREKYLFYILDNQVEPGKALYEQCLHEDIRVDRKYFACILMEDCEKNYELFKRLNFDEENRLKDLDVYSLYVMENKYLFLLASDLPKEEFENVLMGLSGNNPDLARVSDVIEGVQNIRQAYTSVCWPNEEHPMPKPSSQYPVVEIQLIQEAAETDNIDKVEFAFRMIKNDMNAYNVQTRQSVYIRFTLFYILTQQNLILFCQKMRKTALFSWMNGWFSL